MSSKLSRSDRTKSKFAQSNINHLYKGNTSEPHHKPAVRQYGMQVVGKLQGTRRLPPPAWVPSLKAESGGLDNRVTLVPPGGSGWGAPTGGETGSTSATGATPSELSVLATTVNVPLVPENIGTSFEPAFAKHDLGSSVGDDAQETNKPITTTNAHVVSASSGHEVSVNSSGEQPSQHASVWSSRSQSATVAGGGLAANKPFFQRPTPTVSTVASTVSGPSSTLADGIMRTKNISQSDPTSTTLTTSTGWAAVINEEPDFDEHILFSDEETEGAAEIATKTAPTIRPMNHASAVAPAIDSQSLSPAIGGAIGCNVSIPETIGANPLSTDFVESSNLTASSVWHNASVNQSHSLAPRFAMTTHGAPGDMGSLVAGQFGPSSIRPLHPPLTFQDPYFVCQPVAERSIASGSSGIMDYILPTGDIESELQHAQRQMRTQECNIAVDRARMARMKSNMFQMEGDNLLQRSVAGLLTDRLDGKSISAMPITTTTTSLASIQPPLQQFINNVISSPFFSSVQQQQSATGPGRPDLVAAVAAATAAAVAYGGSTGAHIGVSGSSVNTIRSKASPSHSPLLVPTATSTTWKDPYTTLTSTTLSPFLHTPGPRGIPQAMQNALATTCSSTSFPVSTAPSNAVFLDPDYFVERFLEIFNKHQAARNQKTTECSSTSVPPTYIGTVNVSSESNLGNRVVTSNKQGSFSEFDVNNTYTEALRPASAVDDLSSQMASQAKITHTSEATDHVSAFPDYALGTHSGRQPSDVQAFKQYVTRVPGLMDVQVSSSAAEHLAHIWAKNECLSDSVSRVGRGRGKSLGTERLRGRGRQTPVRILNGEMASHRSKTPVSTDVEAAEGRFSRTQHIQGHLQAWQTTASSVVTPNADPKYDRDYPLTTCPSNTWDHKAESTHVISVAHRFRESEQDDLSDIVEDEPGNEVQYTKRTNQTEDKSARHLAIASGYKPIGKMTNDGKNDISRTPYTDHDRRSERTRRARGGIAVQFTHTRSDNSEVYSTSNRYSNAPDHSSYQGSGFNTYGYNSGYEQRKRPNLDEVKANERDNARAPVRTEASAHHATHNPRSNYYQSGDQNTCDQNPSYYTERRYHQPSSYPKYRTGNGGGTFSSHSNYFDQQHFNDNEHPYSSSTKQSNRDTRLTRVTSTRNRSQGAEHTDQGKSRRGGCEKTPEYSDTFVEQNMASSAEYTSTDKIKEQSAILDSSIRTFDDYETSDIPTVRVPAVDNAYRFSSFSRGSGRSGTFPRGSALRRGASGKTNPTQHQNKRSTGGGSQHIDGGSRRYRDHYHYRDGKDGGDGGGASAGGSGSGGTGISAFGSGGGDSTPTVGDSSGTGGSSGGQNTGGGQKDDADSLPPSFGDPDRVDADLASSVDYYNGNNKGLPTYTPRSCTDSSTGYSRRDGNNGSNQQSRHTAFQLIAGRSTGGQGFYRYTTNLSYSSFQRSRNAHILPLMSITPQGPFALDPARFDAMLDAGSDVPQSRKQQFPVNESSCKAESHHRQHSEGHNSTDLSHDDPDDSSTLSDGFMKVVSKSSKKNAKRRLHRELSANSRSTRIQKVDRLEKSTDAQLNHSRKVNLVRSPTSKSKVDDRSTYSTVVACKNKPVRANFTGPPLSTVSTSAAVRGRTSASTTQTADTGITHSRPLPHSSVVTSARTWSKVVGTKSVTAITPVSNADSALQQVATSTSSGSTVIPNIDNSLSASVCVNEPLSSRNSPGCPSHSVVTSEVDPTYNSLQALWKSGQAAGKTMIYNELPVSSASMPVSTTSISTPSLSVGSVISVSNNICKVRPQQQQQPSPLTSASVVSSSVRVPLIGSMGSATNVEPSSGALVCSNDLAQVEIGRPDCEYGTDVGSVQSFENAVSLVPCSSRGNHSSWTPSVLPSNTSLSQFAGKANHSIEGPFSASFWPTSETILLDPPPLRSGTYTQPYGQLQSSDPLSNLLGNPSNVNTSLSLDISSKQFNSAHFSTRGQTYGIQPYGSNLFHSNETHGGYEGIMSDFGKLPSHLQQAPFTSASGSMYVAPQQQATSGQQAHPFGATWAVQHNQQSSISQPMAPAQRYRQRLPQVDPTYGGFPYPTEFQNEYAFQHSGTGVQAPPTGGLYSAMHGQTHSGFPQTSGRQTTVGHPVANGSYPWSLLGTPTGPIGFQAPSQDYNTTALAHGGVGVNGTNGGLLPHPAAAAATLSQGGHSIPNSNCAFTPVSSSVGTTCVGVIGGGRPGSGTQLPPPATRPRGLHHHQNLYLPQHNHLAYSPSAPNHPLQLQSTFYSSLSPSHQRVPLQQFTGSQGRTGLLNQSTGLYATAFAAPSHPNQSTPPPLSNQMAYAPNLAIEPAVSASNPFHSSTFGINSFPNLTQEPNQHTNPYVLHRNFAAVADSRGSNLPYTAAVGLAAGHTQQALSVPVSMSGFPTKHMLSL